MKEEGRVIFDTKFIVRAGIFSAFSAILYIFIKFPLPIFPGFLEIHFDEVPAFIASFAYGPLLGFVVLVIKTLIKLPFTTTMCVGELADFIYSVVFIIPAAIIYKRNRRFKSVLIGFGVGIAMQLIVSLIFNVYIMIPFYSKVFGIDEQGLLAIAQAANPNIKNIRWSLGFYAILPFNAIKDAMVILITLPTYKSLHGLIDKIKM
mgnify:CR=1 FL=1